MNNKIKILGLSAFIATGMVPLGATQIFANEINPTQVEERNLDIDEDYDIDDNLEDIDENEEIDDSEIIPINDYVEDYQSDNNQEQKDNQEDELLIGQPKSNDTPKTSDAGVGGYIGVIIASIGGLFAVIRKMI
ncbi:MAG: hypothetical protein KH083_10595 [Intestinibacter bartlettii]|uniref:hypothetical protein n=1 Tax=Intestinibacter bartlettii TaxID=261299 RepID=UPI00242CC43E|nr:hypothetical protein [Intestinibacter bartlettii]MBS7148845.1 hypothetical protein [Intestinibacter bartlettii]